MFGYHHIRVPFAFAVLLSLSAAGLKADVNCAADAAGCCCRGSRGNADCDPDDRVDVVDLLVLIDHLFLSMEPLPSVDEANLDGAGPIDISDVSTLINFLYCAGPPPAPCISVVNHPPTTILWGTNRTPPYFDADVVGFGLPFFWAGSDGVDHPYLIPPLTYDWRIYGPYDSAQLDRINSQFQREVFVTHDRAVYLRGQGLSIHWCDTTWIIGPPNQLVITCQDMLIDTVTVSNRFGQVVETLDLLNPQFQSDSSLNRIAQRSLLWSTDTSTNAYDLFRNASHDTTLAAQFIFWVRARDADDTTLFDPLPATHDFEVYDPKFENGILIADAGVSYSINSRKKDLADAYWRRTMHDWDSSVNIDTTTISHSEGIFFSLLELLKHRVVILTSDDVFTGIAGTAPVRTNLQLAMSAGLNVWLCGRNSLSGQEGALPNPFIKFPSTLSSMFGLYSTQYSGWQYYSDDSAIRIEDFIGAEAADSSKWPNLLIDTALLHADYDWSNYAYAPLIGALPEVNHVIPIAGAEVLYRYTSKYTDSHPLLPPSAFQQGKPVMTRIDRVSNRVVVSAFTPCAFDNGASPTSPMQTVVDSVMNWLMAPGRMR